MSLRIRLRDLRLERGLTQVQLAEMCGMPQSTISRVESGSTTGVDFDTLDRFAAALGVHPSELIAFNQVTFDYKGKSYVVKDTTANAPSIPEGATTVWSVVGTNITFGTASDVAPGAVIKRAKQILANTR